MRVVSWNVRSLRDGRRAVVRQLRDLEADVVVLQEAPRLVLWRLSRWLLARQLGLHLATRGRAAGNCVLTRLPRVSSASRELSRPPGLHRRGTAAAVLLLDGAPLRVLGTHLDLDADASLVTATAARDEPVDVLCADVNDQPGSAAWQVLSSGLHDPGSALTFPAAAPRRRIDALLLGPTLRVVAFTVVDTTASDHRLLVADVARVGGPSYEGAPPCSSSRRLDRLLLGRRAVDDRPS